MFIRPGLLFKNSTRTGLSPSRAAILDLDRIPILS